MRERSSGESEMLEVIEVIEQRCNCPDGRMSIDSEEFRGVPGIGNAKRADPLV